MEVSTTKEKEPTDLVKKAGILAFTFFLVKGLIWLAVLLFGATAIF